MKHFTFRCVKVTFEEKRRVKLVNGDEVHTHKTTVFVQFENAVECTMSSAMHGHGHLSLYLSDEQFKEYGYRVGQEYVLISAAE